MDLSFNIEPAPAYSVLILISTNAVGGPGKGIIQILPELKRGRAVDPELLTFHRHGSKESLFVAACRQHGVEVNALAQAFNYDPSPLLPLLRRVRRGHTILQTHGYKENIFGLIVKMLTGCPWVAFMHGTTDENLKVRMYHGLDRKVVRFADRIVCVSGGLARRLVPTRFCRKVRIVPNAIERRSYEINRLIVMGWKRRQNLSQWPVITCVGRLSPEKGHRVLLDAAHGLAHSGHKFHLVIVGDGPERATLERMSDRLGLRDWVRFLGQRRDMDMIYAASDILVLPSFKEGMPNVVLEAMANGLAIVATRVGGVSEMVRDGQEALLVRPNDAGELRCALERLVCSPDLVHALACSAQKSLFPRFSVAERVGRIERIYRELAEEAGWLRHL
ncbi:MAG: glycosyltransferase family 4 protein [Acidiferrobacteraceae bacterium]